MIEFRCVVWPPLWYYFYSLFRVVNSRFIEKMNVLALIILVISTQ